MLITVQPSSDICFTIGFLKKFIVNNSKIEITKIGIKEERIVLDNGTRLVARFSFLTENLIVYSCSENVLLFLNLPT